MLFPLVLTGESSYRKQDNQRIKNLDILAPFEVATYVPGLSGFLLRRDSTFWVEKTLRGIQKCQIPSTKFQ